MGGAGFRCPWIRIDVPGSPSGRNLTALLLEMKVNTSTVVLRNCFIIPITRLTHLNSLINVQQTTHVHKRTHKPKEQNTKLVLYNDSKYRFSVTVISEDGLHSSAMRETFVKNSFPLRVWKYSVLIFTGFVESARGKTTYCHKEFDKSQ